MKKVNALLSSIIFVTILLQTMTAATASTTRQINWSLNTAPPFHILYGDYQNQGICDSLMDIVDEKLPGYGSSRMVMPQTRIGQQFEREEDLCFPCMIKQADNQYTVFTKPTHLYFPHGIITSAEKAPQIREQFGDPVQLAKLLASNNFRLGHPSGRRYGSLQPVLDAYEGDNSYRLLRTGENATVAILAMIKSGRVDYTIDYKSLKTFDDRTSSGNLKFLRIAENEGELVSGAIGCTNNEWGRQVVDNINRALPDIQQDPRFLQTLGLWFANHDDYMPLLEQHIWRDQ